MTLTQRATGNRGGQMTDDKCPSQQRQQPLLQECFLGPPPRAQPPLLELLTAGHSEEESGVLLGFHPSCCTLRQHLQLSLLGSWDLP